jgi:hypothetical protein
MLNLRDYKIKMEGSFSEQVCRLPLLQDEIFLKTLVGIPATVYLDLGRI